MRAARGEEEEEEDWAAVPLASGWEGSRVVLTGSGV